MASTFMSATASLAMAETDLPPPNTYGSPYMIASLGSKVAKNLHIWSGNKPVFILRRDDFGDRNVTFSDVGRHFAEIGMPQNIIPNNDYLKKIAASLNDPTDNIAAAYNFKTHGVILGIDSGHDLITENVVSKSTGFNKDLIEHLPKAVTGYKNNVYKHEAGHLSDPTDRSLYDPITRVQKGEIIADQHAANLDGIDWTNKNGFDKSFSTYHMMLVNVIRTVHNHWQTKTHDTGAHVYLPWETRNAAFQEPILFKDNSMKNFRALRMYAVEGNTDKSLWNRALHAVIYSAALARVAPRESHEKINFLVEHRMPQAVIDFIVRDRKTKNHHKVLEQDLKQNSLETFFEKYKDQPEFLDALKERAGYVLGQRTHDKKGLASFIRAASIRSAEINYPTIEKRFLRKYLAATKFYFPQTFEKSINSVVVKNGQSLSEVATAWNDAHDGQDISWQSIATANGITMNVKQSDITDYTTIQPGMVLQIPKL